MSADINTETLNQFLVWVFCFLLSDTSIVDSVELFLRIEYFIIAPAMNHLFIKISHNYNSNKNSSVGFGELVKCKLVITKR